MSDKSWKYDLQIAGILSNYPAIGPETKTMMHESLKNTCVPGSKTKRAQPINKITPVTPGSRGCCVLYMGTNPQPIPLIYGYR